jgi:hypothetical protein
MAGTNGLVENHQPAWDGPVKWIQQLRAVLRGVIYSHDFDALGSYAIDGNVRQGRE